MLGSVSPKDRLILWPYISRNNVTTVCDRVLIYDWSLDEASYADISCEAMSSWLSQGYTLDTINAFGNLDNLPYSLDAPFWKTGAGLLGIFGTDHKLNYLQGGNLAAEFVTGEGQGDSRMMIRCTRPHIDCVATTVNVVMRERDGDSWAFGADEVMEDTGEVPAWSSGNIALARIRVPDSQTWSFAKGIKTDAIPAGNR